MKNLFLLLVLFFTVNLFPQQNTGILKGKVTDAQSGEPLIGANVLIVNTKFGAATDIDGVYKIINLPAGKYKMAARYIGYKEVIIDSVTVDVNQITECNFELPSDTYQLGSVEILHQKPKVQKNITYSVEEMGNIPVRGVHNLVKTQAGVVGPDGNLYVRGSRSDQVYIDFNTEEYSYIRENDFFPVVDKPLSTFSIDVDAAAYSNVRRFIMDNMLPPPDAVRIEEFINYFDYNYPAPKDDKPFSVILEYSDCPWNKEAKLVQIGLKGKQIERHETKASNLVFLLDVSGSMASDVKLPLVQKAFNMLVDQLNEKDKVAIVVYAGAAGVVLPSTSANKKFVIKEAINRLHAGGSTAGGEGLMLAYKIAEENFINEGNNRIILATDGDFNIGISNTSDLVRFIEKKRDKGIFFTALGFGMGNYKDDRLQELADKGNGNHAYIDNIMEAKKVFVNELSATLYTIAKDVKIQVEFNPAEVKSYRLIGYENRLLNDQDFEDDTKDAGEIGSGHTVTALYEIIPENADTDETEDAALKYQVKNIKPEAYENGELLTLKIRYKQPDGDKSVEYETVLKSKQIKINNASDNFIFAAAVAEFAMLLRNSVYKGESSFESVLSKAKESKGKDEFGYRAEFINLVERASLLAKNQISELDKE